MEQNAHCSSSRQCIIVALGSESEKQGEEDSVSNKKETWWDSSWFTSEKLNSLSIKDRSVQMMTCGPNPILNQDAKWFDEKKLVRHVVTSMMSEQSLWGLIVIITEDSSQNRVNTILMESCQEQKSEENSHGHLRSPLSDAGLVNDCRFDRVIIEENCDWEVELRLCFSKIKRFWTLYWIEMTSSSDMSNVDWKCLQSFDYVSNSKKIVMNTFFFDFWMRSVEGHVEQFGDTSDFTLHHNVDDGYDNWTCEDCESLKVVNDCQFFQLKKRFSEFPVACKTQKQMGF